MYRKIITKCKPLVTLNNRKALTPRADKTKIIQMKRNIVRIVSHHLLNMEEAMLCYVTGIYGCHQKQVTLVY